MLRVPTPGFGNMVPPGDFDDDGDVDWTDLGGFAERIAGPNLPPSPAGDPCIDADLDNDGDVDLLDFAAFSVSYGG